MHGQALEIFSDLSVSCNDGAPGVPEAVLTPCPQGGGGPRSRGQEWAELCPGRLGFDLGSTTQGRIVHI